MNRALIHLTGGALLVVCIEAAQGTSPAAIPLAFAFARLAIAGFGWVQRRRRAVAAGYVVVQLVLGYALFATAGAGSGATLLLVVLVIQTVLLLPLPWAVVVAALVPLMHLGMPWRDAAREATITVVVVAFAVVLAALYLDVQRARTELAEANAQLRTYADQAESLATAAERTRLAREIHDGLGHHLTVVQMQVRAARAVLPADRDRADELLGKAEDQSRAALAEVRRSVAALREPWEGGPVTRAIEALAAESAGPVTSVEVRGDHRALPPEAERALYRAAQEALTNVRKHAAGTHARVLLDYSRPGTVRLQVEDDGQGLPADQGLVPADGQGRPAKGYGLTGVRERVGRLGGTVELASRPGAGVTMTVELPG
ncbi:MAG TPA: sensor histidine kinase [Mycobacteriales bacterium]|nr:sensor histidine kinase [Mycobacteriales bacterium]